MSDLLELPRPRKTVSADKTGEQGGDLGPASKTSLVINKSLVDASALLRRFAGKPAGKTEKPQTDVKSQRKRTPASESNKAGKRKNHAIKSAKDFPSGSIVKEPKGSITKEPKSAKHEDDKEKDQKKENGDEMPDCYEDLDEENLSSFRELFNTLDQSHTGSITADNLYQELRRIDSEITYEEVEDVLKRVDTDGSGTIDFDEFLYHMTQMGDELLEGLGGADEEKKKRFTRRKRLFYSALTQFSLRQTLADLEKQLLRIRQAPHVISHYTAGARLIGLNEKQLEKQMKRMQKSLGKTDSPYAQRLQFVHLGTKKIVKRRLHSGRAVRKVSSLKEMVSKGVKQTGVSKDDAETKVTDDVEDISKEIKNQLKLLATKGSIAAQLPGAEQIIKWRRKIGSVSAQLKTDAEIAELQNRSPVPEESTRAQLRLSKMSVPHSFVTVKSPDDKKANLKKRRAL